MEELDRSRSEPSGGPYPGQTLGFLEVLDRSGNVSERVRLTHLPVSIGRAYDNDIIIADPYVCPHHLRLSRDETGHVSAEDLGSVNGLLVHGSKRRVPKTVLASGSRVTIGHTRLRFRNPDYQVEPALPDRHTRKILGTYENRLVQLLIFAGTLGALWLSNFFETVERQDALEPAFDLLLPVAVILVWGGAWAFAGRVITHRITFLVHCAIACAALLTIFALDTGLEYFAFALSADDSRIFFGMLGGLGVLGVALYSHLRFSTLTSPVRLASVASAITIAIGGLLLLKAHIDSAEFSAVPQYHVTLKAPAFRLVSGESADDFFSRVNSLRESVVADTKELTE